MSLRIRMLLASATVVLIVVPGVAVAGAGTGGRTNEDDQMVAAAKQTQRAIAAAYNDKKWDELRLLYMDDALMVPPNHEPVRGRDAIAEYLRGVRDAAGPFDMNGRDIRGSESARVRGSGGLANFVYGFTIQSGHVRMTSNELYERQPDGSVLIGIDEFSLRDAAG